MTDSTEPWDLGRLITAAEDAISDLESVDVGEAFDQEAAAARKAVEDLRERAELEVAQSDHPAAAARVLGEDVPDLHHRLITALAEHATDAGEQTDQDEPTDDRHRLLSAQRLRGRGGPA